MMAGLRTGQVAAAAGVNLPTLRYYERRGLLAEPERTWAAPDLPRTGGDGAAGNQGRAAARIYSRGSCRAARHRATTSPRPGARCWAPGTGRGQAGRGRGEDRR